MKFSVWSATARLSLAHTCQHMMQRSFSVCLFIYQAYVEAADTKHTENQKTQKSDKTTDLDTDTDVRQIKLTYSMSAFERTLKQHLVSYRTDLEREKQYNFTTSYTIINEMFLNTSTDNTSDKTNTTF